MISDSTLIDSLAREIEQQIVMEVIILTQYNSSLGNNKGDL